MKAVVLSNSETGIRLELVEKPVPLAEDGFCIIKLQAAALNRRDYWISVGKYPGIKTGVTLGSDGCGIVVEGPEHLLGRRVWINPNINWGSDPEVQSAQYSILGMPVDGTLAEYIKIPSDRAIPVPDFLTAYQSSAFPLAALTAFRAVFTKANINSESKVLITGIGGGVSLFALLFAISIQADVFVNSSKDWKIEKATQMGATAGFNYTRENWVEEALKTAGKFDVVIDSAGGSSINDYLRLLNPGGKIVSYGSTNGKPEKLDVFRIFWNQISLIGTTMGNDEEFQSMTDFVNQHKIQPTISIIPSLELAIDAINEMAHSDQFGKVVISIAD